MTLERGYLHWVELDKRRPALIISPGYRNEHASDLIVIPCSTRIRSAPTHVLLRASEAGLARASILKCEQLTTLPRSLVSPAPLGPPLSSRRLAEVERAVLRAVGIPVPI